MMTQEFDLDAEYVESSWAVAAEVVRGGEHDVFLLRGIFFPLAYANASEWASDFGLEEKEQGSLDTPRDFIFRQEMEGACDPGMYPNEPQGMTFWRQASPERFFVTLEANAREFALIRQQAAIVRALGHSSLIGE